METPAEKKARKKAYYKVWYEKNRDAVLAKQKERNKADYQAKKEQYKTRSKKWREENPERYKAATTAWAEKNREKVKATSAAWYRQNRDRASKTARANKLARMFNMTVEQFESMKQSQGGNCAICGTFTPVAGKWNLHVDHCHSTGKVRGLLCHHCNVGLGAFKDSLELLNLAAGYLRRSLSGVT